MRSCEKLLTCPFCGGTPKIITRGNDHTKKRSVTIKCPDCRAERTDAGVRLGLESLERNAIFNWNQRP